MRSVFFDPGRMTNRLVLETLVETPDGQGGATLSCQDITSVWAIIEPADMRREEQAGAHHVTLTHRIWLRFRSDIRIGMRFRQGDRMFTIRSLQDADETRRYLLCMCEEEGR